MDRREALRTTSFVVGYSLSASAIAVALNGCKPEAAAVAESTPTDWSPAFLNNDQVGLVSELAETLIPETTTPGAKSVLVHQYIDDSLQSFYPPLQQYKFVQGLDNVQALAQAAYNNAFQACTAEQRVELLKQLEAEDEKLVDGGTEVGESFFSMLKNMTFRGYFTSEKIGKEVLAFDPVPGAFKGCIPYSDVGKLWSI